MGDSIMRPPVGHKNMPWRVSDAPTAADRTKELLERFTWLENGSGVYKANPMIVLMYDTRAVSYKILVGGRLVGWRAGRATAAKYAVAYRP